MPLSRTDFKAKGRFYGKRVAPFHGNYELIQAIYWQNPSLSVRTIREVIRALTWNIRQLLAAGQVVNLYDFGRWGFAKRTGRKVLFTGEDSPDSVYVKFKPCIKMRQEVRKLPPDMVRAKIMLPGEAAAKFYVNM